jgi:lysophospholipase L1-like esterase
MHFARSSKRRLIFSLLSLVALVGAVTLGVSLQQHASQAHAAGAEVASDGPAFHLFGPKQHYLALGDSLAFGFQPNGDFTHGYVNDLFQILQNEGTKDVANLGCGGETSTTFIQGGCPSPIPPHFQYTGPQLDAAVNFLKANAGKVSPVTLDIGGNDVLHDTDPSTCTVNVSGFNTDLATLDSNLKGTILPALLGALTVDGRVTGSIVMMNYYDPLQNFCPNTVQYTETLNAHLAADVSGFGIIVDVFDAFGGPNVQNPNICTYTWICSALDIHATDLGYSVIAGTFAAAIPSN